MPRSNGERHELAEMLTFRGHDRCPEQLSNDIGVKADQTLIMSFCSGSAVSPDLEMPPS